MTKMPIVDDNDQIIDYKDRSELDYDKDIYRSTALWVYDSNDRVLLAQRKFTKERQPGKWGPSVAGTVEGEETYDDNAVKEAQEEIGLEGVALEKLRKVRKVRTDDEVRQFTQWYAVKVDEPVSYFIPQHDEVETIEWIARSELVADFAQNPDKYISSMQVCIDILDEVGK